MRPATLPEEQPPPEAQADLVSWTIQRRLTRTVRRPLDVDGYAGECVPYTERRLNNQCDEHNDIDRRVMLRDVDRRLEQQFRQGDPAINSDSVFTPLLTVYASKNRRHNLEAQLRGR